MSLKRTKLLFWKTISFVVLFCFTVTTVAWPNPSLGSASLSFTPPRPFSDLNRLSLPGELGRVDEVYLPEGINSNSPLIVFLQDAHANLGAQEHIAAVARELGKKLKVEAIFKEGGSGEADLAELRNFPGEKIKSSATQFWMEEAVLSGIEREAILSQRPYRFFGIEDQATYEQGGTYFLEAQSYSKTFLGSLKFLAEKNHLRCKEVYNPALFRFEELISKFETKQELVALVSLIANEARNLHINRWKYLEIEKFIGLILLKLEGARAKRFFEIQKTIEAKKLFEEIELLKREIREKLLQNKKERLLHREAEILKILKALVSLESTPQDFERFLEYRPSIAKYVAKRKLNSKAVEAAETFYRSAHERDQNLFKNIKHVLDEKGIKRAFLVAGGFHSPGMIEQFRKDKIPYVLVTPQISERDLYDHYLARVSGKRASIEVFKSKQFETRESTYAASPAVFNRSELRTIRESFELARNGRGIGQKSKGTAKALQKFSSAELIKQLKSILNGETGIRIGEVNLGSVALARNLAERFGILGRLTPSQRSDAIQLLRSFEKNGRSEVRTEENQRMVEQVSTYPNVVDAVDQTRTREILQNISEHSAHEALMAQLEQAIEQEQKTLPNQPRQELDRAQLVDREKLRAMVLHDGAVTSAARALRVELSNFRRKMDKRLGFSSPASAQRRFEAAKEVLIREYGDHLDKLSQTNLEPIPLLRQSGLKTDYKRAVDAFILSGSLYRVFEIMKISRSKALRERHHRQYEGELPSLRLNSGGNIKRWKMVLSGEIPRKKFFVDRSDEQIRSMSQNLKTKLANQPLEWDDLILAISLFSETAHRIVSEAAQGKSMIDPQIVSHIGGLPTANQIKAALLLFQNKHLIGMRPSEGKTLSVALAAYLKALSGTKVEVHDWSNLLSARDAQVAGAILDRLGMKVAAIIQGLPYEFRSEKTKRVDRVDFPHLSRIGGINQRSANNKITDALRTAYQADVVYGPYDQMIFNWMNDWFSFESDPVHLSEMPGWVIVEEVDTPFIDALSEPLAFIRQIYKLRRAAANVYIQIYRFASSLRENRDFVFQGQEVHFSSVAKERELIENLKKRLPVQRGLESWFKHLDLSDLMKSALQISKGETFQRDVHYFVSGNNVVIRDLITGETKPNKRWGRGIHTFLEIKERLPIARESNVRSFITTAEFYNRIPTFSGVIGITDFPTNARLSHLYGLSIHEFPPAFPSLREEWPTRYFLTAEEKEQAIVELVQRVHSTGKPIFINAQSPLEARRIKKQILKLHGMKEFLRGVQPVRIIDGSNDKADLNNWNRMGETFSITIAAQMASRGHEIKLDEALYHAVVVDNLLGKVAGLFVMSTHHGLSTRTEEQTKDRAARRGKPGVVQVFDHIQDNFLLKGYAPLELERFLSLGSFDPQDKAIPLLFNLARLRLQSGLWFDFESRKAMIHKLVDYEFRFANAVRKALQTKAVAPVYLRARFSKVLQLVDAAYDAIQKIDQVRFDKVISEFETQLTGEKVESFSKAPPLSREWFVPKLEALKEFVATLPSTTPLLSIRQLSAASNGRFASRTILRWFGQAQVVGCPVNEAEFKLKPLRFRKKPSATSQAISNQQSVLEDALSARAELRRNVSGFGTPRALPPAAARAEVRTGDQSNDQIGIEGDAPAILRALLPYFLTVQERSIVSPEFGSGIKLTPEQQNFLGQVYKFLGIRQGRKPSGEQEEKPSVGQDVTGTKWLAHFVGNVILIHFNRHPRFNQNLLTALSALRGTSQDLPSLVYSESHAERSKGSEAARAELLSRLVRSFRLGQMQTIIVSAVISKSLNPATVDELTSDTTPRALTDQDQQLLSETEPGTLVSNWEEFVQEVNHQTELHKPLDFLGLNFPKAGDQKVPVQVDKKQLTNEPWRSTFQGPRSAGEELRRFLERHFKVAPPLIVGGRLDSDGSVLRISSPDARAEVRRNVSGFGTPRALPPAAARAEVRKKESIASLVPGFLIAASAFLVGLAPIVIQLRHAPSSKTPPSIRPPPEIQVQAPAQEQKEKSAQIFKTLVSRKQFKEQIQQIFVPNSLVLLVDQVIEFLGQLRSAENLLQLLDSTDPSLHLKQAAVLLSQPSHPESMHELNILESASFHALTHLSASHIVMSEHARVLSAELDRTEGKPLTPDEKNARLQKIRSIVIAKWKAEFEAYYLELQFILSKLGARDSKDLQDYLVEVNSKKLARPPLSDLVARLEALAQHFELERVTGDFKQDVLLVLLGEGSNRRLLELLVEYMNARTGKEYTPDSFLKALKDPKTGPRMFRELFQHLDLEFSPDQPEPKEKPRQEKPGDIRIPLPDDGTVVQLSPSQSAARAELHRDVSGLGTARALPPAAARAELRSPGLWEDRLLEGVGEYRHEEKREKTPDWQRMNVAGGIVLERLSDGQRAVKLDEISDVVIQKLKDQDIYDPNVTVKMLMDRLVNIELLKETKSGYRFAVNKPHLFAVKTNQIRYILEEFRQTLKALAQDGAGASHHMRSLINNYAEAATLWRLYPVESLYPVLKAVALLERKDQERLTEFLSHMAVTPQNSRLVFAILLVFKPDFARDWFKKAVPTLEGRDIIYMSPETWLAAGGLGRVGQSHVIGAKKLVGDQARVITIEPYHPFQLDQDGIPRRTVNYAELPIPVKNLRKVDEFTVRVRKGRTDERKNIAAEIFEGETEHGIISYLIKDKPEEAQQDEYYTKLLYGYGERYGAATWEEFSEFMSKASIKLNKRIQKRKLDTLAARGEIQNYKPPVLWEQDGQYGPFAVFKRISDDMDDFSDEQKQNIAQDPEFSELADLLTDPEKEISLKPALNWFSSHTFNNRKGPGWRDLLYGMRIPERYHSYLKRYDEVDPSSGGIRGSDGANGVSAMQVQSVANLDPEWRILAITNGDNLAASNKVFRSIFEDPGFQQLFPGADPWYPTPEQLDEERKRAKTLLKTHEKLLKLDPEFANLDPEAQTFGNTGRLVTEKTGLKRAFTDENILKLVKAGRQVIILGNVQASDESHEMLSHLRWLQKKIKDENIGPGRLIVATGWNVEDQRAVLAALDVQVNDSDPITEAAGFSETNAAINGGIEVTLPTPEGVYQQQGEIIDWSTPGVGNTIIVDEESSEGYWRAFDKLISKYDENRLVNIRTRGVTSVRLSRALDALPTSAAYLLEFAEAFNRKENPVGTLTEYVSGNESLGQFFKNEWLRQDLIRALDRAAAFQNSNVRVFHDSSNRNVRAFFVKDVSGDDDIDIVLVEKGTRFDRDKAESLIKSKEAISAIFEQLDLEFTDKIHVTDAITGEIFGTYTGEQLIQSGLPVGIPSRNHVQVLKVTEARTIPKGKKNAHASRQSLFYEYWSSPAIRRSLLSLIPRELLTKLHQNVRDIIWWTPDGFFPSRHVPKSDSDADLYLIANKGRNGRLTLTLTPHFEGVMTPERRREAVLAHEGHADIILEVHGNDLQVDFGRMDGFPEASTPDRIKYFETDRVFHYWFDKYLIPFAKRYRFQRIRIPKRIRSNQVLTDLGFKRVSVKTETEPAIWELDVHSYVSTKRSELRKSVTVQRVFDVLKAPFETSEDHGFTQTDRVRHPDGLLGIYGEKLSVAVYKQAPPRDEVGLFRFSKGNRFSLYRPSGKKSFTLTTQGMPKNPELIRIQFVQSPPGHPSSYRYAQIIADRLSKEFAGYEVKKLEDTDPIERARNGDRTEQVFEIQLVKTQPKIQNSAQSLFQVGSKEFELLLVVFLMGLDDPPIGASDLAHEILKLQVQGQDRLAIIQAMMDQVVQGRIGNRAFGVTHIQVRNSRHNSHQLIQAVHAYPKVAPGNFHRILGEVVKEARRSYGNDYREAQSNILEHFPIRAEVYSAPAGLNTLKPTEAEDRRAEVRSGQQDGSKWKDNIRPSFLIKPEEILFYYKRVGESVRKDGRSSIFSNLPTGFRNAHLIHTLDDQESGLAILTLNEKLAEFVAANHNARLRIGYEIVADRKIGAAELEQLKRGKIIDIVRQGIGGRQNALVKPDTVEIISSRSNETRVRLSLQIQFNRQVFRLFEQTMGFAPKKITQISFGEINLTGITPGSFRRVDWQELVELMRILEVDESTIQEIIGQHKKVVAEETEDRKVVLKLLDDNSFVQNVFKDIYARTDLSLADVTSKDVHYVDEGGFRRVYQVTLRVDRETDDFSFLIKVVKPDIIKSDSGYAYDKNYVDKIYEVVLKIRSHFLFLHPPIAPYSIQKDEAGRTRLVSAEGLVPPTNAFLSDQEKDFIILKAFMMLYALSNGKIFVADPKRPNVIVRKAARSRYYGTLIDLDNIVYDKSISGALMMKDMLEFGFDGKDIVEAIVEILGTEQGEDILRSGNSLGQHVFSRAHYENFARAFEEYQRRQDRSIKYPVSIPQSIQITINGLEQRVPANAALYDVLKDRYVDFQDMVVEINGKTINQPQGQFLTTREWKNLYQHPLSNGFQIRFYPKPSQTLNGSNSSAQQHPLELANHTIQKLDAVGFNAKLKALKKNLANLDRTLDPYVETKDERLKTFRRRLSAFLTRIERFLGSPESNLDKKPISVQEFSRLQKAFGRIDFKSEHTRAELQTVLSRFEIAVSHLEQIFNESVPAVIVEKQKSASSNQIEILTIAHEPRRAEVHPTSDRSPKSELRSGENGIRELEERLEKRKFGLIPLEGIPAHLKGIEEKYDLGKVLKVEKIMKKMGQKPSEVGFLLHAEAGVFFVKKLRKGWYEPLNTDEAHFIGDYVKILQGGEIPIPMARQKGNGSILLETNVPGETRPVFYTVEKYLVGRQIFRDEAGTAQLERVAKELAKIHTVGRTWKYSPPENLRHYDMAETVRTALQLSRDKEFQEAMRRILSPEDYHAVMDILEKTVPFFLETMKKLSKEPIISDFNFTNMMFSEDRKDIVGIFDMDQARWAYRFEDFLPPLIFGASGFKPHAEHAAEELAVLVRAYQKAAIEPLTQEEIDLLPYHVLFQAANSVLNRVNNMNAKDDDFSREAKHTTLEGLSLPLLRQLYPQFSKFVGKGSVRYNSVFASLWSSAESVKPIADNSKRAEVRSTLVKLSTAPSAILKSPSALRSIPSVSTVTTDQKKRLIIPLAKLNDAAFQKKFLEVLKQRGKDPNLEFAILATGFELKAEQEVLALFRAKNIFVEYNVQLFGSERFGQDVKSEIALMNRMIELMRKEVGLAGREFSTRVITVGEARLLERIGRRDTPKLLARPEAVDAALLLFELDGAIDWFKIAPNGYIDPTRGFVASLEHLRLTSLNFSRAA